MFNKIKPDTNITQEVQKKQFKITTEDLRRFLSTNGEDKELNDKLRVWSTVEKNSVAYDETSLNSRTISVYNIPEPKDSEENSETELAKGDKTWNHGQLDKNGQEVTYKVKQEIIAEPDEEILDYVDRNFNKFNDIIRNVSTENHEVSFKEAEDIINFIKKGKTEELNQTNKPKITFIQRIKNWFGIK